MKTEKEWEDEYCWLLDALKEKYGERSVKSAVFDCGGQWGIAVSLSELKRVAVRLTDFSAYSLNAKLEVLI